MQTIRTIGRYRIEGLLGAGAMGEVYRAHDPVIDRAVAIKVVRPELISGSGAEQWLQRFRREARAAGRRSHPNIVAIFDIGDDEGRPFLAMEFVDGRSLDAILKESAPLDPGRSVAIIAQVLSALGFAHESGIVHRDVKPSNIMVLQNGQVKVADFGIARIDTSDLTIVGDLLGTPAYMAPEQLSGAAVDYRTDLFAAGVILFEMLTGVKPFRGKSITEIMSFMETRGPEDIRALNPAVPVSLKRVIAKALAFDPAERFADAGAFSAAVAEAFPARSDEPFAAAQAPTLSGDASFHPDLLREIERDLTTFIGPLASIAVKRAVRQAGDLGALYDLLGNQVESPSDRAEFLARGRRRAAVTPDRSVSSAPLQARKQRNDSAGAPRPADLVAIEASLTRYIGPIARILIKRELGKFDTLDKFYLLLAAHIPDEQDRKAFLAGRSVG